MNILRRAHNADIDWDRIHARLAQAAARTRQALAPSLEHAAILLDERARRLAQPFAAARTAGSVLDFLVFGLSDERYAIEARYVQEVCRLASLTPVPGAPELVAGVVNLRGQILVVFDVRLLFGLETQEATDASRIVVCGSAQPDLGLLVDSASDVVRLTADEVQTDAVSNVGTTASLVCGITRDATIVIDAAALLTDQRLFVDQLRRSDPFQGD